MVEYTIAEVISRADEKQKNQIRHCYEEAKKLNQLYGDTDLDKIFEIVLDKPEILPIIKCDQKTPQNYLYRWVKGYCMATQTPPSRRMASPKTACEDPAIETIVRVTQGVTLRQTSNRRASHNLFMSAENVQGNLLEEYIAQRVRPYGFLWCDGVVLKSIDFCNTNGAFLLQIKNKHDTENSSSNKARVGTPITKWYRLKTRHRKGVPYPDYMWAELNKYINDYKTDGFNLPPCDMSEGDYEAFLEKVAKANHSLITSE